MMISPSNVPSVQVTGSLTVTVSPCDGGEASTGEARVIEINMSIARNEALRMVSPEQRETSILLCLVRYVFPANSVANKVE